MDSRCSIIIAQIVQLEISSKAILKKVEELFTEWTILLDHHTSSLRSILINLPDRCTMDKKSSYMCFLPDLIILILENLPL